MHSLAQEIRSFSRANLRKQRTRVTTLTGRRVIETWRGACLQVEEEAEAVPGGGFVRDLSCDLQVGAARRAAGPLGAAGRVTHILNVAYGVQNAFLNDFIYKTISILDLPETDIISYFPECFEFIEKAKIQDGVVLVHCNAGVSRAAAIVIGFLMNSERLSFASAFSLVKSARPSICPNPGFMEQLHKYQEQNIKKQNDFFY
uniref:Dual specificity phosphatase 19 n=1 Tax=Phasianus colchicus TaxID=9054 RepID=A0A669QH84_PHACC